MTNEDLKEALDRERGQLRQALQIIESGTRVLREMVDSIPEFTNTETASAN